MAPATLALTERSGLRQHGPMTPSGFRLAWAAVLVGLPLVSCGSGSGSKGAAGYDVAIDPYRTNPLAAVVNLRGVDSADVKRIQVVVTGQGGGSDFVKTYLPTDMELVSNLDSADISFPEAGFHVPVYGLYADRENDVRIHVDRAAAGPVDLTLSIETALTKPSEGVWVPRI